MNLADDRFRLHAYVDGELTPDEVADFERFLAEDPDAMADVAALRAQGLAMHARYDGLLATSSDPVASPLRRRRWSLPAPVSARAVANAALAAAVLVALGVGTGWTMRGRADRPQSIVTRSPGDAEGLRERRLQSFVQFASLSHAVFVPEVRHPVEVAAADEAHLVAWLSKRLDAPLVIPHLGDAGWNLLGGRLLPAEAGPVAQFMYQDAGNRRLTLAVSRSVSGAADPASGRTTDSGKAAAASFRIADEAGSTVFYWIDADYAYALTGRLPRSEMTALAGRVHRQLER